MIAPTGISLFQYPKLLPMTESQLNQTIDFSSDSYRDAYRRVNGIVLEGEQQAHDNFVRLAELLPQHRDQLFHLAKIEARHRKSFTACGLNLNVIPDLDFARQFFADLHRIFQEAADQGQVVPCLVVQALVVECFAIAAYNSYIPVADSFARKISESVVQDEYQHLNFGEVWLKDHFAQCRDQIVAVNQQVLPIVWRMLNQVEADITTLGMTKMTLLEEFMTRYGEAFRIIGFEIREILRMSVYGLKSTPMNPV